MESGYQVNDAIEALLQGRAQEFAQLVYVSSDTL
jgi:hypothetical protein